MFIEAEEAKYTEVYTQEGKQVLVLFATEYGFSEEVPAQCIHSASGTNAHIKNSP